MKSSKIDAVIRIIDRIRDNIVLAVRFAAKLMNCKK